MNDLETSKSDYEEQYLLEFLRDEFRNHPQIRLREMKDGQDRGISLKTESREYFFPFDWAAEPGFKKVRAQIARIKDALGDVLP